MKILEKLKLKTETAAAKLWSEYRTLLERDNGTNAPRLAELLIALELTPKHAEFHKQVLAEARRMKSETAGLPKVREEYAAAEKKTRELRLAYNEALVAVGLAEQAEPGLRRRVITLAERESDLLHLRRRFPELLGAEETERFGEFPDNPPASLRNLAKDLGLPALAF